MGSFFRGFLCGMGIGFIIAPMRGQEMRRLVSERLQTLRGSLPDTGQLQQYEQQISDNSTSAVIFASLHPFLHIKSLFWPQSVLYLTIRHAA